MWFQKKQSPPTEPIAIPDDIGEAQSMRARANADHREVENQGAAVTRLTRYLAERRELNHFGESIQITYTRRGHA